MEKEKINVAEILRNCQAGMNLDCVCFENVVFDRVDDKNRIRCFVDSQRDEVSFNEYGCLNGSPSAKCVIFPKGKTTWEGFVLPCKYEDGNILAYEPCPNMVTIYVYRKHRTYNTSYYVALSELSGFMINDNVDGVLNAYNKTARFATQSEKQKLFDAIKANGYRWNEETKTLEKLIVPKFKEGDVIMDKDSYTVTITEVVPDDECYEYESLLAKGIGSIGFDKQDEWELVSDKFDITTLVPFESRVLVRDTEEDTWVPAIWGCYVGITNSYCVSGGIRWEQCIPYEGNEHLLGKTDNCNEYFKT